MDKAMNIETSTVTKLLITEVHGLEPISVYLENLAPWSRTLTELTSAAPSRQFSRPWAKSFRSPPAPPALPASTSTLAAECGRQGREEPVDSSSQHQGPPALRVEKHPNHPKRDQGHASPPSALRVEP